MNKDFELFKKEFKRWQEKFGLNGWRVYFKYESFGDGYANITIDLEDVCATVRLNESSSKENKELRKIEDIAKHEAIHLLLANLAQLGRRRYINTSELYIAEEELAHRLEGLIE